MMVMLLLRLATANILQQVRFERPQYNHRRHCVLPLADAAPYLQTRAELCRFLLFG